MTFSIRTPEQLTDRAASAMEAEVNTPATPLAQRLDARQPHGVATAIAVAAGVTTHEVQLHLQYLARELMPDRAIDTLDRHLALWGIRRIPATYAAGNLIVTAVPGTVLADTLQLRVGNVAVQPVQLMEVDASGVLVLPVRAVDAGVGGNLSPGLEAVPVTPVIGLTASITVDANGITGGADQEDIEDARVRLLERIADRAVGGSVAAYRRCARDAGARYVSVKPGWVGVGTVGVIAAMDGPRAPDPTEVDILTAALMDEEFRAPGCRQIVVVPAVLRAIPVEVALFPDSEAIRTSVTAAVKLFFEREAEIGGTIYRSRLSAAISAAGGEYSHKLLLPVADVEMAAQEIAIGIPPEFA